ncbi:hypothetical protein ACFYWP_42205 [Actinacidiphila glaucinigra]|uniref:hypothetical protein n=1 Tax=Actinacidiphila glaucinigra TaxID=235986 RepID=UPI003677A3B9
MISRSGHPAQGRTAELKREALALVRPSARPVTEVARKRGVSPEELPGWVK